MKIRIKNMWLHFLALLFVVSVAHAQPAQQAQANFSQPELEQMLAPIALYPDALLSQILMASTYPTEVVEASYWIKANPGLKGEDAVNAAQDQQWDISVKSLLPFPQVLGTMESKLDWTQNLGNAFLGQEQQVMDTVQLLRRKAMAAGYLKSDNRVRVAQEDQLISINLVQPTAVYVPYYNPTVVYGTWSAPAYAPVYWDPWPGYAVAPGYYGWAWAPVATVVAVGVLYGAFNWRSRHVYYGRSVGYWSGHSSYSHYRYSGTGQHRWGHDATHRRDIPYRNPVVNQRFGRIAATHNAKVGPRPTVSDIRTGKHTFTPVGGKTGLTGGRTGSGPVTGGKTGLTGGRTGSGPGTTGGRTVSGPGTSGKTGLTGGRTGSGPGTTGGRTVSGPGTGGKTGLTGGRTGSGPGTTGGRTVSGPGTGGKTGLTGGRTGSGPGTTGGRTGLTTGGKTGGTVGTTGGRTGGTAGTTGGRTGGTAGTTGGRTGGGAGSTGGRTGGTAGTTGGRTGGGAGTTGGRTGGAAGATAGKTVTPRAASASIKKHSAP